MRITTAMADISTAPIRDPRYASCRLEVEHREDGAVVVRNTTPADTRFKLTLDALDHWAQTAPDRPWLAERSGAGWRTIAYAEARAHVAAIAGGLRELGLPPRAPLLILARNGVDHALIAFAAMSQAMPIAAVSPQYGLAGADLSRLAHAVSLIRPGAVFVGDGAAFAGALEADFLAGLPVIAGAAPRAGDVPIERLLAASPAPWIAAPDDIAKLLLTSGSTGKPKAVMMLHRGAAVAAAQVSACYDDPEPPVVVNQAPWSHSLGANAILQMVLHRGGTLYIDAGQPVAGRDGETVRNLTDIATTYHNMVPAGWDLLAGHLERDQALARNFFSRVRVLQYGGAGLGQSTCDRIMAVAARTVGERISFAAGFGATETGPTALLTQWPNQTTGLLGVPVPGTSVKLVPAQDRQEVRVKGPQITPGYYNAPEASAAAFDEEGYYRCGDAARMLDPARPELGLVFDGRLSENFKLSSGTFVNAGALRIAAVSAIGGAAVDAVVCGEGQTGVGLLIFVNESHVQGLGGREFAAQAVRAGLERHNAGASAGGGGVARALLLEDTPHAHSGEITDKGYINQTLARARRTAEIERLFAASPAPDVMVFR